jgi:hypothetical protein
MHRTKSATFVAAVACVAALSPRLLVAEPAVVETRVIGPFAGIEAPLHPDNLAPHRIEFFGTDLGFTYEHDGQLQIIFGDTSGTPAGDPIEASTGRRLEDSFGSIDLAKWNSPERFTKENMPLIRLGQNPDSAEAAAIDPGHALEGFKTPVGGFSNGSDEFGAFFTYKPQGCRSDDDCENGAQCDVELGYIGPPYTDDEGITWGCVEGTSELCIAATMTGEKGAPIEASGFCTDRTSTIWANTPMGRVGALSLKMLIGKRDRDTPKKYHTVHVWHSNKFMNPTFRTVNAYDPEQSAAADFAPAKAGAKQARVFVWGRPHFVGVNAAGRELGQYFAYVDMPSGDTPEWQPRYFAGLEPDGQPRFSANERDAVPLDLDSTQDGVQVADRYDVVNQVSIAWVPELAKWLMFYGGGMIDRPLDPPFDTCGVLEIFTGPECRLVDVGNGAFRMRTADNPWGPWTPPQDLIAAGDPSVPLGQYGPGGMLRHPDCAGEGCAPRTSTGEEQEKEYGFFYSANIIEQWTRPAGDGVDVIWNASTWDPYRVILLRTRIEP